MKGPYERRKYDLDRIWECPSCQHRQRSAGTVTSRLCECQAAKPSQEQQVMRLVFDGPRRIDGVAEKKHDE